MLRWLMLGWSTLGWSTMDRQTTNDDRLITTDAHHVWHEANANDLACDGWCVTMADDARPWWTMHDHIWTMLVDTQTQLCDYWPSCRIQNNYFKIKYTLSVCCLLSDSPDCQLWTVWCQQSNTDWLSVQQLTIRAQMVWLSDCFNSWLSDYRMVDGRTLQLFHGWLSDCQMVDSQPHGMVDCWTVRLSTQGASHTAVTCTRRIKTCIM